MARDLPPLNALRMFEAASRHLNFTKASQELFVTQGAVSRQIKLLEDNLQQSLFVRDGSKLGLTPAGERYREAIRDGLAIIRRGTTDLRRVSTSPTLTVSVLPSFATLWLVPRIVDFLAGQPDFELQVSSSYDVVDFTHSPNTDVAIRLGKGDWPGVYSEKLFSTDVFPVCSPRLLRGASPFRDNTEVLTHPLIYATEPYDEWDRWFAAAGVESPEQHPGTRYSDQQALQQAAIEGQGIALARSLLVESDLTSGRLIRPSGISVRSQMSYFFVCPHGQEDTQNLRPFLEWLRREAARYAGDCVDCNEPSTDSRMSEETPAMRVVS